MKEKPSIFISYSSKNTDVADHIDEIFKKNGIKLTRDIRDVEYKESFIDFMDKIRETNFALFVISDEFLKSENCMYEVIQFMKDKNFKEKFLPVVLDDVNLKPKGKAKYQKYWKKEYDELVEEADGLPPEDRITINQDLKHYRLISMDIGDFLTTLSEMRFESYENLKSTDFKLLFDEIEKRGFNPNINKQIKILAITAAPQDDLYYEQEQNILINAVQEQHSHQVFLDMPDPVKSTLTELDNWGKENEYDIVIISAHGSKDGFLCFEDENGNEVLVSGKQIVEKLKNFKIIPKIVILSSCHSAAEKTFITNISVAKTIFDSGLPCIVGMKKSISHFAAIDFNKGLLQGLLENKTIHDAYSQGTETIKTEETKRLQDKGRKWPFVNEEQIPELFIQDKAKKITISEFSENQIKREKLISADFGGAKFIDRAFVGRRKELRDLYNRILVKKEPVITIKGQGGSGKSALTTRACSFLKSNGYELIIFVGPLTASIILEKLFKYAISNEVKQAKEISEHPVVEWQEKAVWLVKQYITQNRIAIILDNFEDNQEEPSGNIKEPGVKEFLHLCNDSLHNSDSVILITTRYSIPALPAPLELKDMKTQEARKLFFNYESLATIDDNAIKKLLETTGTNPRLLELVETLSMEEFGKTKVSINNLTELIDEAQEIVTGDSKSEDYTFTPWFINRLTSYLTTDEKDLLKTVSLFRMPVDKNVLSLFYDTKNIRRIRKKLIKLSLIYYIQPQWYGSHKLTSEFVEHNLFEKSELIASHKKAAEYFANIRDENNVRYIENLVEAEYHYKKAGQYNQAFDIMDSVQYYLSTHGFTFDALNMVEEYLNYALTDKNRSNLFHSSGILLHSLGRYNDALEKYEDALQIAKRIGNVSGEARSLHQIGNVLYHTGSYNQALEKYEESLEIKKRIGDVSGESISLHQVGMIYQAKGLYDDALEKYEESLEIARRIGDVSGEAKSLHQIGNICYFTGSYDQALEKYEESLEIAKRIGDVSQEAISLHQIGRIYEIKDLYDQALEKYEESLEILKRIGDVSGEAKSLHQIGIVYQVKGLNDDALKKYEESLEITKRIGDVSQEAKSLHQIGMIYEAKALYVDALEKYEEALDIKKRIGDIIGMALTFGQLGVLSKTLEKYKDAFLYFSDAYLIFKKIGSPSENQALNDIKQMSQHLPAQEFETVLKEKGISLAELEQGGAAPDQEEMMRQLTELYVSLGEEKFVEQLKQNGAPQEQIDQLLPAIKKMAETKK